jgi:hypothetical protein
MCMQCKGMCQSCKTEYINRRLRQCANLFANLGTDSTKSERDKAYAEEERLLKEIMQVDLEKGKRLLNLE